MDFMSSSSSRTIIDLNPEKRVLEGDDAESSINLDELEITNLGMCDSFDFMNEDILPYVKENPTKSPPLSLLTVAI